MRSLLISVLIVLCVVGCGPKITPIVTAPVDGVATFEGKPLENYRVFFYCEKDAAQEPATGRVGADGSFVLSVRTEGDGAIVGTNRVWLTYDPPLPEQTPGMETAVDVPEPAVKLPEKFTSAETSGISVEVPKAGLKGYKLELK